MIFSPLIYSFYLSVHTFLRDFFTLFTLSLLDFIPFDILLFVPFDILLFVPFLWIEQKTAKKL